MRSDYVQYVSIDHSGNVWELLWHMPYTFFCISYTYVCLRLGSYIVTKWTNHFFRGNKRRPLKGVIGLLIKENTLWDGGKVYGIWVPPKEMHGWHQRSKWICKKAKNMRIKLLKRGSSRIFTSRSQRSHPISTSVLQLRNISGPSGAALVTWRPSYGQKKLGNFGVLGLWDVT